MEYKIEQSGGTYYVASNIVPILDTNNEIIEFLSLRYDITELIEAKKKQKLPKSKINIPSKYES
jgi:hypothetical protein